MPTQLAVQMYTLRNFTKTPADIASALARVKKMGYDAVQLSALGPIEPAELAKILKNEGLQCVATHIGLDRMKNDTAKVIEEHRMWGCSLTAIGGFFPKAEDWSLQLWQNFIADYNAAAAKFAGSGVRIGYHNHSHELARVDPAPGGKTAMDMLFDGLSQDVWFEIDTYWIQHGGGDPAAWVRKCKGRIPAVHMKDLGMKTDRTQFMMEVGEGNMNWPSIIAACKDAGVQWYIVEQDTCYRDPFESLEISLRNLKSMGLS
ncbi:MAG TPA: sugar phosphate isomerase/epimerase [Tepidisphaeraceae bacterium]|nr:sugar phosphate isomerase/epimerase [Tepidisphaeraceae bacterium]